MVKRKYPQSERTEGGVAQGNQLAGGVRMADDDRKRSHRMLTDIQYQRFGDRVYWATASTIHTNGVDYDLMKFFRSVKVTYKPK